MPPTLCCCGVAQLFALTMCLRELCVFSYAATAEEENLDLWFFKWSSTVFFMYLDVVVILYVQAQALMYVTMLVL